MTVAELLSDLGARIPPALAARAVAGLALDSRRVSRGDLFFALPGQKADGAQFAGDALSRGAVAVVAERAIPGVETVEVATARRVLALAASRFYGHPERRIELLGVTGTNGKTTTTLLVGAVIEGAGEALGIIGTLGASVAGKWREGTFTTPEAPELCALLDEMAKLGVRHCAMEVSSEAIAQERVSGLRFAAAGFTHLTRDHLNFHGDMEHYFAAKRRLFTELLAPSALAVVNGDDAFGARLAQELVAAGRTVWRFGRAAGSELQISGEELSLGGTHFSLATPRGALEVRSPLIGAHNVENLALAAGLSLAAGFVPEIVVRGLGALQAVPGRLEAVNVAGAPAAFVDYAHTDDALARVLAALRSLGARGSRRLIAVFGCGGDRDRGKRPLMGKAVALGADVVVATSDNPRTEEPLSILAQIEPGIRDGGKEKLTPEAARTRPGYLVEPDRAAAVALAVDVAGPDDVILVAGKGHESYQIIGTQKLPFDDRDQVRRALQARVAGRGR